MRYHTAMVLVLAAALLGCHQPHKKQGKGPLGHHDEHPYNLPPSQMLLEPGPGVGGPGPGVLMPEPIGPMHLPASQVKFVGPDGMVVRWSVSGPSTFDSEPLVAPGSHEFPQGAIYRLKLTNIPGRAGVELYPTIEVGPATPRSEAFLAHNAIPVQFTEEDFDQVLSGNFVTKVIYLPDPEFQELAVAGIEVLVSTRLDPGVDPIVEADRRGAILAIVRVGNKDLQLPGAGGGELIKPAAFMQTADGQVVPIPDLGPTAIMPGHISGVTGPMYGMPYVGTPIGLPGPPHVPLGGPAGLKRHEITNHTKHQIPGPTHAVNVHVKQHPGLSYPKPANTVYVQEFVTPGQKSEPRKEHELPPP